MGAKVLADDRIAELCETIDERWREKIMIYDKQPDRSKPYCIGANICLTEENDPQEVLDSAVNQQIDNMVQKGSPDLQNEVKTSAMMVVEPMNFINFPVSAILAPNNACKDQEAELAGFRYEFSKANEKVDCLTKFREFLSQHPKSANHMSELVSAADELFTNAVFNAPFVSLETNENPGKDRADNTIEMGSNFKGVLFAGVHNDRLVVGCKDPFGTLQLKPLLTKIQNCYRDGVAESMNLGPGGAGIGSFLVFNTGSSYYVAIVKGEATVVSISVPINISARKRSQLPKNLHFFEIEQGEA